MAIEIKNKIVGYDVLDDENQAQENATQEHATQESDAAAAREID